MISVELTGGPADGVIVDGPPENAAVLAIPAGPIADDLVIRQNCFYRKTDRLSSRGHLVFEHFVPKFTPTLQG